MKAALATVPKSSSEDKPSADNPKPGPVNAAREIDKLMRKLKGIKDRSSLEARAIRRALRALGHTGGLRASKKGGAQ